MTVTNIKDTNSVQTVKTPNERMKETTIKQGMVFKVHRGSEEFIIVIVQANMLKYQAICLTSWNRFTDEQHHADASVGDVMKADDNEYTYFEIINKIEITI